MFALAREKTGDRAADIEAEHRAKYNKLIGKFFWDKCLFQDTHIHLLTPINTTFLDIGKDECILANIRRKPGEMEATRAYVRAGPREELHFNPKNVNAAIVTCGGLCPGLNNVIREITRSLYFLYGIEGKVYGIVGGYKGFYDPTTPPIVLTPEK